MAVKLRSIVAIGGPNLSDSGWHDLGESLPFAAFTNGTTATILPIQVVPLNNSSSVSGGDAIPFAGAIGRLMGAQLAFQAAGTSGGVAASTISRLGLATYRTFCTLSGQIAAADGARTTLPVTAVNTALPSGQTVTVTTAAGATPQVWTTSAAVGVGATSLPVNSATPSATYAVGTPLVGIVGNAIAFGWRSTGDGATGTPAFRQNGVVALPAMAAAVNGNLVQSADPYGAYLPLLPGDLISLFAVTDSSTFAVPAGILSTMAL